jgi:tight adherence protein B
MNVAIGIIVFLVLFAIVLVAVGAGSRLMEIRGRKQMESMLADKKTGDEEVSVTTILIDPKEQPGIEGLLENTKLAGGLQVLLQQSGLPWTPSSLIFSIALLGIVGGVLGLVFRPLGFVWVSAVSFALLLGALPYFYVRHKRKARMTQFEEQLPEALDFLARSMRAGHAFSIALEMLGTESPDPLGQEFRTLFAEQNLGAPLDVCLNNFAKRVPLLDVRLFTSSVLLQRQTGGNLGEVLTRLAFLIRERFRLRGQVKAASAHGRLTSLVLTILPIVLVVALQFVAPGYLTSMAEDPDGRWMIVGAIGAQILGYYVMRRITDIKV